MFGSKPQGDSREGMTLIGEEAFFHGTLSVKGSLRVEGAFEGDISDAVEVEVGIKGRILGNVAAENVVVAGEIIGNVVAAHSLELLASAKLVGDIRSPKLKIDEGASFDGMCSMGSGEEKVRRRRGKTEGETAHHQPEPIS